MIPSDIKWDPNATPPQFTDNGDQVIEKGTHLRIKIMGTRSDVGSMFAIGSIKEDFLGFAACLSLHRIPLTFLQDSLNDHVSIDTLAAERLQRCYNAKPWLGLRSKMQRKRLYDGFFVLVAIIISTPPEGHHQSLKEIWLSMNPKKGLDDSMQLLGREI